MTSCGRYYGKSITDLSYWTKHRGNMFGVLGAVNVWAQAQRRTMTGKKMIIMVRSFKSHREYKKYPLRICRTRHHCKICNDTIYNGEQYYDGGLNLRAHFFCVDNISKLLKITKAQPQKCPMCNGKGKIEYYHDAGDHFGAGTSPYSEWREKACPKCGGEKEFMVINNGGMKP